MCIDTVSYHSMDHIVTSLMFSINACIHYYGPHYHGGFILFYHDEISYADTYHPQLYNNNII